MLIPSHSLSEFSSRASRKEIDRHCLDAVLIQCTQRNHLELLEGTRCFRTGRAFRDGDEVAVWRGRRRELFGMHKTDIKYPHPFWANI
jgi:hypothetical protein